jgi:hypothetical protein
MPLSVADPIVGGRTSLPWRSSDELEAAIDRFGRIERDITSIQERVAN